MKLVTLENSAINHFSKCGADPNLLAGSPGLERSALHFVAYSDNSLKILLGEFESSDEEKQEAASAVSSNPSMNEELKQDELN